MTHPRLLSVSVCGLALLVLGTKTHATTISYNFTYTNVMDQYATVTSTGTGTGSFTIMYTALGAQPASALTAFSFVDTITETAPTASSSTFTYKLSNVASNAIIFGGTLANPILADLVISTFPVTGSNVNVGTDSFTLQFAGANPGDGSTQTASADLGYDTTGQITLTPGTATPEPAALPMLGLLFGAGTFLSRGRWLRRSSFNR